MRRLLRIAGWAALAGYFAFALLILLLRYAILPQIDSYRGEIETALTRALKLPVSIGAIEAGWAGLRPQLGIRNLVIRDAAGRAALGFDDVEAELAWSSLWHFGLRLSRLEIVAPDLDIRRDAAGRYFVAGLAVTTDEDGGGFRDWLLAQERIVVRDAALRWHDELRAAPPLVLKRVNFDLQNSGSRHRFGFTADPPAQLAARLDVRGDFRADDIHATGVWRGEAYAELDYADLAVWRTWIDYPVELPRGSGGLRLWLGFAGGQATGFTADVRLADLALRLGDELPMLDLVGLEGRIGGRRLADGFEVEAKHLSLSSRDGIVLAPTDLRLKLRHAGDRPVGGEVETAGIDLGAATALAAYLPLEDGLRRSLAAYAPRGRLQRFKLAWSAAAEKIERWRIDGSFENLGLNAWTTLPGFAGLSGNIVGDERSGTLTLAADHAALELPAVFPEPRLALDALTAQAAWHADAGGTSVQLARAAFRNRDAGGEAAGSYRLPAGGGLGEIDLTAKLTRASGSAVWRYMPLVVNKDARDWLKDAIAGGTADEATLRLKGDLAKFPFRDGKDGLFQVRGRFRGATLRYAPGWPEIRELEGDLLFEGVRMLIRGRKGSILGVGIGPVAAEIADLEAAEELLTIDGRAAGATADFLRFIEASPVGARIDHATEDMTASGNGELRLRLDMPLRHIDVTKVDGRYRFVDNQVLPTPDMPPLTGVFGELHFTGDGIDAQKLRAAMLGAPGSADIVTAADGSVVVKAAGSLDARTLVRQFGHPLFDHLSGSAPWNATVKVRGKSAEVRVESGLLGMASSLPAPFNKSATETLPLVVERKPAQLAGRDRIEAALGDGAKLALIVRRDGGKTAVERGAIAIGTPLRLPERGLALAARAKRIDLDFWRRLGTDDGTPPPVDQVDLRCDELVLFDRSVAAVRVSGTQSGGVWKLDLKSSDAAGNVEWDGRGAGKVSGRLALLSIPEAPAGKTGDRFEPPTQMPAADLTVDRLVFHGRDFGSVKLKADNAADGYWTARFEAKNDDASLEGSGRWRPSPTAPDTRIDFKLTARSIEKLIARLGYPDALRRGTGKLEGSLSWRGTPVAIDYGSLAGKVRFEAADGQFNKLEPGVGRLLGVLSLQSLPRRLTLDFRDVFSDGFAFDGIGGEAAVTRGVMETENLLIAGPAAKVMMAGRVNLGAETQDLRVRVQPAIGESVATGVLLANPTTGAAAWVFNKLFGNPLDRAFAYDYAVTGSWADPKVEKVSGPQQGESAREGNAP